MTRSLGSDCCQMQTCCFVVYSRSCGVFGRFYVHLLVCTFQWPRAVQDRDAESKTQCPISDCLHMTMSPTFPWTFQTFCHLLGLLMPHICWRKSFSAFAEVVELEGAPQLTPVILASPLPKGLSLQLAPHMGVCTSLRGTPPAAFLLLRTFCNQCNRSYPIYDTSTVSSVFNVDYGE